MSTSQDRYDEWKEHGGDLQQYRQEYHTDVTNDRGRTCWFPSFVYRFRRNPQTRSRKQKSDIGEQHRPPHDTVTCENCNTIQSVGTDEYSHLLWKHNGTDTWVHVKSGNSIIVGEPVGFKAYVTIEGQSLTVGEYRVSADPHEVFEWAREWMKNNPDGYNS